MTNEFYRTGHYEVDPSTFGGVIHLSDFNPYPNGKIVSRIIADWAFDCYCKNNYENNKRNKKLKRNPLSNDWLVIHR